MCVLLIVNRQTEYIVDLSGRSTLSASGSMHRFALPRIVYPQKYAINVFVSTVHNLKSKITLTDITDSNSSSKNMEIYVKSCYREKYSLLDAVGRIREQLAKC